jgi:hypothetical protein
VPAGFAPRLAFPMPGFIPSSSTTRSGSADGLDRADRRLYGQYRRHRDRTRRVFEETFNTVGAPLDIRTPEPASSFFIDGKLIDVGRGGWSLLLGQLTKQASRILEKVRRRPLRQPSRRPAIDRGLAQDLHQQSLGACDLPQPLRGDLRLQRQRAAGARLPDLFHQQGRLQAFWLLPARHDRRLECARNRDQTQWRIWLSTPAVQIHTTNGRVEGVTVVRDGQKVRIETDLVISNAGPKITVALTGEAAFPPTYVEQVRSRLRPAANIVNQILRAGTTDLPSRHCHLRQDAPALQHGQPHRHLPELAPPGWHLYVAYAVPVPALGDFDSEAEVELALTRFARAVPEFCAGQRSFDPGDEGRNWHGA